MELYKIMLGFNKKINIRLLSAYTLGTYSASLTSNSKGTINCVSTLSRQVNTCQYNF